MKIEEKLTSSIAEAIQSLYGQAAPANLIQLQKTKKEFEGHLTLVVFPFLKLSKKKPEQTAQEIGEYLVAHQSAVASFNVIKGFLNLTIASSEWIDMLSDINRQPQYGFRKATEQ